MTPSSGFKMTHAFTVLPLKDGDVYPVPCEEWNNVKGMIQKLSPEPWLFHTAGSIALGAGLSTAIAVLTGSVRQDPGGRMEIIAWAIAGVCTLVGISCLVFAGKERKIHREQGAAVLTIMQLIENRFERSTV